jgi:cytosine/adenosine deaminase-related metal-dependent hydrolase
MEIPVGLGSEVGAGTTLDMFEIMRSMIFVQNANMRPFASMERAFYYATRSNAKILEIDKDYGEICEERIANFLSIRIPGKRTFKDSKDILSHVIFKKDFDRELLYY